MAEKTILKKISEMQVGDIIIKNRVIEAENNTFKIDVKNRIKLEVIEPYKDNGIVLKNLETGQIKIYHDYSWIQYDVLIPKKTRLKAK